ncbi:ATP-binding cassette domain-containing protein [Modestobacter sp. I12A-02628]|uniref:ABC transporter ATP-binding protein n=1 Tax=Goekera deserti TaxID=2497753 RepID=A0A7K3WIV8_9ACTN|nr:ABC transporter ATP-binding protein [Goekera deserti]MPQ97055.1 ATP-binding cassette domain-containing protein [Goekera deserti]NDI46628.1 ATP-binding cassette domain-containing protein [Goekera deserti]NEL56384.1 ABC transporter ATP-binding protein [Goekera deserti]
MTSGAGLPVAGRGHVRRAALGLLAPERRAGAGVLLLTGAAAVAGLAGPWLIGRIVDTVLAGGGTAAVDRLAAGVLAAAAAQLVLTRLARRGGQRLGERVQARIRETFLDRSLALPAAAVERVDTGDLATRGTSDVAVVGGALRDVVPAVAVATVQALALVVAVLVVDPLLGLTGTVGLLGVAVAARWYLRRARAGYLAEGATSSVLAEQLTADTAGARTIEALGLQQRRTEACGDAVAANRRAQLHTLHLRSVLFPAVDVSAVLPVVLVLVVGGALVDADRLAVGAVVTCALYLRQLAQPLDVVLQAMDQLQSSAAAFARVEGVASLTGPPPHRPSAVPDGDRIELHDVHFAHGGSDRDAVAGVRLTVQPGERLALVGPSGAGKTTLGLLLAGVHRPRTGSVTVGGVPVADLAPEQLRRQVVLVTQEQHLFLGTVRDNLDLARPGAADDELAAALVAVGAGWVLDLPGGLDTVLGPDGHRPDAAALQQLALARVVLADPHTVVLDEATALLDPASARRTEAALAAVLTGRTVIAIAHRLHTASAATRVAVMQQGRLTEVGTHEELVDRGGAYAALWASWHGRPDGSPAP